MWALGQEAGQDVFNINKEMSNIYNIMGRPSQHMMSMTIFQYFLAVYKHAIDKTICPVISKLFIEAVNLATTINNSLLD